MGANHRKTHDRGRMNALALLRGLMHDGPLLSAVEPQRIRNNLNAPSSAAGSSKFMTSERLGR